MSTIETIKNNGSLETSLDIKALQKNYVKSVNDGLLKIFSKMGISTLQSYHGSQVFEILGINKAVVDKYFTGAVTRIGGLGLDEIARESLCKHKIGFGGSKSENRLLPEGGIYQWKRRGEAALVQSAQRFTCCSMPPAATIITFIKTTPKLINEQSEKHFTIRGLLDFAHHRESDQH